MATPLSTPRRPLAPLPPQPRVSAQSLSAHKFVSAANKVAVEQLAFLQNDGETATPLLVTAGSDCRMRLWSCATATLLHVLPLTPAPGLYSGVTAKITALYWDACAAVLVAGDRCGGVPH